MDPNFWKRQWQDGKIAFHEKDPNELLASHVARLGEGRRVLVPLCGKTEDMAYLASRGHDVVGVELVEDAARAFFAEHGLTPVVEDGPRLRRYHAARVTILVGDFFAATTEDVGSATALYDRAALIALPPELRARYVPHLRGLLAPGSRGIVVTVTYDEGRMEGPPFSVGEDELRRLYAGAELTRLAPEEGREARGARLSALAAREKVFEVAL